MNNALLGAVPGCIADLANLTAQDGTVLTSLVDHSGNGNHFAVDATDAKKPIGYPENLGFGGLPIARFVESSASYAQAATKLVDFHKSDFTVYLRLRILQQSGLVGLFTTWHHVTYENSIALEYDVATEQIGVWLISLAGVTHLNFSTTAHLYRVGDLLDICWRRSGSTSKFMVRRASRFDGDPDVIDVRAPDTLSGTPDPGAATNHPTIGAHVGLDGNASMDLRRCRVFNRSITDAEQTRLLSLAVAEERFAWRTYAGNRPLIIGTDLGTNAPNGADDKHPNDAGQLKHGQNMADATIALAAELGITAGTLNEMRLGDSRMVGFNSSANANTGRNQAQLILASEPYSSTEIGPNTDEGGHHGAVSGAVIRDIAGGAPGLSRRTPGAHSMDNYYGSGKSYNVTHVVHWLLGINWLTGVSIAATLSWDQTYEILRESIAIASDALAFGGVSCGFALHTEPATHLTTTGPIQRLIIADLRDKHMLVEQLRRRGIPAVICNLHDHTYQA